MNKIDIQIANLKKSGKIGLMTHAVVGYPSLLDTEKIIDALVKGGSDFIELQIPFSDPLADGPLIMKANEVALKQNIHVSDCLILMEKITKKYNIPFLFMGYFNSILRYGVATFCNDAQKVGASGLIIPDIPPEEEKNERFLYYCKKNNLHSIRVLSPASNVKRIRINSRYAEGFVYMVRGYGVTGSSLKSDAALHHQIKKIKQKSNLLLALGFGIANPRQIEGLKNVADIAVVGSAIINLIMKQNKLNFKTIERFVYSLKEAC